MQTQTLLRLLKATNSRGAVSYSIEVRHDGLNKYRQITGRDPRVVENKAQALLDQWNSQWATVKARADKKQYIEGQKRAAQRRTAEARSTLEDLEATLRSGLSAAPLDWEDQKNRARFAEAQPQVPSEPSPPAEPSPDSAEFQPQVSLLDRLIPSRAAMKRDEASLSFKSAHDAWIRQLSRNEDRHRDALDHHERELDAWRARRDEFLRAQDNENAAVDELRRRYNEKDPPAVEDYCERVLAASAYPAWMPRAFELAYAPDSRTLVVSFTLPPPDDLPRLREVSYIQSRDEFREKVLTDAQARRLYDSLLYQIALRTTYEIFQSDEAEACDAVAFNGYVTSIDRTTGQSVTACVLSLHAVRHEFQDINLSNVDPKACFKALKGVGSSKLHSLTPVAAIMELRRDDGRFVSSRALADSLDDSVNLAMMDWEDFEHLIREVFEQEFQTSGGEVKVTKASRDGGVDAIAFDPDPIRGGKIVIQAKRYTNTVGVAAVRDLYGTVMNEGATKGILVTTSDYGPDAYAFAKDKPLSLMSGANLLHLLERHGHRAKIDIKEARELRDN
ncbi:MAG: restriction endonuclease [Holophagales bacterium]|nr:restriction endonuclease [Holophagales bacterium]MYD22837.1 restriction endonuclease [Holophagales bacterium]MYI32189.1 restriction endonuclease [Holophagales bacterium]